MRIALLSMIEPARVVGELPRAALRVGGVSLARHQLGVVIALGCQRIICLSPGIDAELMALQHVAEDAGANFHRISGPIGLLGLVSAGDELIALNEGLLAWPELAISLLDAGPAVLVQPVETGLAAGFERMDINHAAAGALRIPGRLVERLAELPGDYDAYSALQRVALQAGVLQRLLPPEAHEGGRWSLVTGEADAHAVEAAWIRLHTTVSGQATPAMKVARKAVRMFGPALLHAGSSGTMVAIGGVVLELLGLVLGWFGLAVSGLVCCAAAWVLFLSASLFGRVERSSLRLPLPALAPITVYGWLIDGGLALIMTWNFASPLTRSLAGRAFAPLILLGLTRLVARVIGNAKGQWLEDRSVLALVLAIAGLAGGLAPAIGTAALAVLGLGLYTSARQSRLTPA